MENEFYMYVLTDTHYVSKRLWEEGEPINSREKGDQIALKVSPEIIDTFFDKILSDKETQYVLITGDLVNSGEQLAHEDFQKLLNKLTDAGKKVMVTTATHDYCGLHEDGDENIFHATYYGEKACTEAQRVSKPQLRHLYDAYGVNYADSVEEESGSYSVLLQKGIRLIAINDNGNGRSFCGLFENGVAWLTKEIKRANQNGEFVMLAVHHPVIAPWSVYARVAEFEMYGGYRELSELMCRENVKVIFTGHTHVQGIKQYCGTNGNSFYDITTSSLVGASGKMRKVTVNTEKRTCRVESIGIQSINHVDTRGLSAHDYIYSLNFTGQLERSEPYILSDYNRFVSMAGCVLPRDALMKYKPLIQTLYPVLGGLKMKALVPLSGVKLSAKEKRLLKNERVLSVLFTVCRHIFAGNAPFTPDTPEYRVIAAWISKADNLLKLLKIDLSGILSPGENLLDLAKQFLYNSRTGNDDRVEFTY